MENWQFLVQKQGEHSWYTLESPNLRIVAGNYRVLARSHLPNIDVEIRVTHFSDQEVPPKRKILKRLRRTNAEGLMAVIPFTYFHPGTWELRCSCDLMADILGNSWQYTVKMQVLAEEAGEISDNLINQWENLQEEAVFSPVPINPDATNVIEKAEISPASGVNINSLLTEVEEDIFTDQPVSPVWFRGETAEQILQSLVDFALPTSYNQELDTGVVHTLTTELLKLNLDHDYYICRWGEALTISGSVERKEINILQDNQFPVMNLLVELRSPLEPNKILNQFPQVLTDKILPFRFSIIIQVPAHCESKLILANLKLHSLPNDGSSPVILGSHVFTITADVTELLTISRGIAPAPTPDIFTKNNLEGSPATIKSETSFKLGLELFNLVRIPNLAQFNIFKPAPKQPLPPQIKPLVFLSKLDGSSEKLPLQLPKLPSKQTNPLVNPTALETKQSEGVVDRLETVPTIDLGKLAIKQLKTSFPYLKRLRNITRKIEIVSFSTPNPPKFPDKSAEESPEKSPELVDIPSTLDSVESVPSVVNLLSGELIPTVDNPEISPLLKLWIQREENLTAEYFYGDYTSQTTQEQNFVQSTVTPMLKTLSLDHTEPLDSQETPNPNIESSNIEVELETGNNPNSPENVIYQPAIGFNPPSTYSTPVWLSEEIVLDETYSDLEVKDLKYPQQIQLDLSGTDRLSLPTPQLYVPDGELLAGSSVKVRIELPQVSSSVAIKLWVEDCQTRYLLDGPHLITDLNFNIWGVLEAVVQLNIPFGCLEMRLEAIAIDTNTQQESHKVSIMKTVIPPDLPQVQLEPIMDL